jgi:ABC-type multidrug transport system ATPase subunit
VSDSARGQPILLLEGATVETPGERLGPFSARGGAATVGLVGNFRAVFRLLSREARLVQGRAELFGTPCTSAVAERVAGLALCDPPLVLDWNLERYLLESARLTGMDARHARREVDAVLATVELSSFARHRIEHLSLPLRRTALIAAATLAAPLVLCAETPLAGLDTAGSADVFAVLERAAAGRRLLVSVRDTREDGPEGALVAKADWVVVESRGSIVREGPPSRALPRGLRYVAVVTRASSEFLAALAEAGIHADDTLVTRLPMPPDADAEPVQVFFELPRGASPNDVVQAARRAGAPIVELSEV